MSVCKSNDIPYVQKKTSVANSTHYNVAYVKLQELIHGSKGGQNIFLDPANQLRGDNCMFLTHRP